MARLKHGRLIARIVTSKSGWRTGRRGVGVSGGHVLLMDVRIVRSNLVHAVLVIYSETEAVMTVGRILMKPSMRGGFGRGCFETSGLAVDGG
jgi:hypothetical protein